MIKNNKLKLKKNKPARTSYILLICFMLSLCIIGSTLAKYTVYDEAGDVARVSKFGVNVQMTGALFGNAYKEDHRTIYSQAYYEDRPVQLYDCAINGGYTDEDGEEYEYVSVDGRIGNRFVYSLSANEVTDYFGKDSISRNEMVKMLSDKEGGLGAIDGNILLSSACLYMNNIDTIITDRPMGIGGYLASFAMGYSYDQPYGARPVFQIDLSILDNKACSNKEPQKGDLIALDLNGDGTASMKDASGNFDEAFRVLSFNGSVAKVLAMKSIPNIKYNSENVTFSARCAVPETAQDDIAVPGRDDNGKITCNVIKYKDSDFDKALNITYYNSISDNTGVKSAIKETTNLLQDIFFFRGELKVEPLYEYNTPQPYVSDNGRDESGNIIHSVVSKSGSDEVVAPGTRSDDKGLNLTVNGKSEVAISVNSNINAQNMFLNPGTYAFMNEANNVNADTFEKYRDSTNGLYIRRSNTDKNYYYDKVPYNRSYDSSTQYYILDDISTSTKKYYPVVYSYKIDEIDNPISGDTSPDSLKVVSDELAKRLNKGDKFTPTYNTTKTYYAYQINCKYNPQYDFYTESTRVSGNLTWKWNFGDTSKFGELDDTAEISDKLDAMLGYLISCKKDDDTKVVTKLCRLQGSTYIPLGVVKITPSATEKNIEPYYVAFQMPLDSTLPTYDNIFACLTTQFNMITNLTQAD